MSDQMPDEVWVGDKQHRTWPAWTREDADNIYRRARIVTTRYIRADLYEQVKDERDRLRAALDRVRELAEDGKDSPCGLQICEEIELIAQDALSHD